MKPFRQYTGLGLLLLFIRIEHVTSGRRRRTWDVTSDLDDPDLAVTPSFMNTPSRVTYRQGQVARLECKVKDLGTKKVIWRRASDPNPLTISGRTFVADTRVTVDHAPLTPGWTLVIDDVRLDDAGQYECQVASRGHDLRTGVKLNVKRGRPKDKVKPEIHIKGKTFVETQRTITLVCNATGAGQAPDELDWFHDGQKLDTGDGKITIEKDISLTKKTINSVLRVSHAIMEDKGIYVCRTSDLQIASVRVDVLNADSHNVRRESTADDSSSQAQSQGRSTASTPAMTSLLWPRLLAPFVLTVGHLKQFIFMPT